MPREKQQVDEVFIAVDFQSVLTTHESEHAAHVPQKILNPGDNCPFQLAFVMFFAQFQKIESIFILYCQPCLRTQFRRKCLIEIGLTKQGFFIALVIDLMNENVPGPTELAGHA